MLFQHDKVLSNEINKHINTRTILLQVTLCFEDQYTNILLISSHNFPSRLDYISKVLIYYLY